MRELQKSLSHGRVLGRLAFALPLLVAIVLMPQTTRAGADFDAGWQAYEEGRFAQAVQIWTPLAEAGNLLAQ
ncbi:MAG: hypothetical protein MI920_00140, partial [Kiloniellales bacterium]|nr:hypothetical protein [Kiloniellales bacterium]